MDTFIKITVYVLSGLLGLCVGSFLNVVIYRLPHQMSLAFPPSHCTSCDYRLRWYDNIPILSYLLLGGKCRKCREHISLRYTLVELANTVLWLLCAVLFWEQSAVYACTAILVCSLLICVFFIDLEHMIIFDRFQILLALCGIVAVFFDGWTVWYDHLIGAAVGAVVFLGLYYGAIKVLGKEGLGFGDVKLAAVAGLLLGWQKLIFAMLIASVSASVVLLILRRVHGDEKQKEYPFAPFITVGMAVSLLFGNAVLSWYVQLIVG